LSARPSDDGLHFLDLRRDLIDLQVSDLLLMFDVRLGRLGIRRERYLELADPRSHRPRSAGSFKRRNRFRRLADVARQKREALGIKRRLRPPVGDAHGKQLDVEGIA